MKAHLNLMKSALSRPKYEPSWPRYVMVSQSVQANDRMVPSVHQLAPFISFDSCIGFTGSYKLSGTTLTVDCMTRLHHSTMSIIHRETFTGTEFNLFFLGWQQTDVSETNSLSPWSQFCYQWLSGSDNSCGYAMTPAIFSVSSHQGPISGNVRVLIQVLFL